MVHWQHGLERERELGRRARRTLLERFRNIARAFGVRRGATRRRSVGRHRLRAWSNRSIAVVGSLALHVVLIGAFLRAWSPAPPPPEEERFLEIRWVKLEKPKPKPAPPPPEPPREETRAAPKPLEIPPAPDPVPIEEPEHADVEAAAPGPVIADPLVAPAEATADEAIARLQRSSTIPRPDLASIGVGAGGGSSGGATGIEGLRGSGRGRALSLYGGSQETEDAVARGLRWLAAHQEEAGFWDSDGFQRHCTGAAPCPGPGTREYDVGVTGLTVLAFLGAGHSPEAPGLYRDAVGKALEWLLRVQGGTGGFGVEESAYFYNQAIAALALAEAYALTRNKTYREGAERAIAYIERGQQPGGGWDYGSLASGRQDLSVTGWVVMSLRTARLAGLSTSPRTLEGARRFLDAAFLPTGEGVYADSGMGAGRRGINMSAVALLSHYLLDGDPNDARARLASERILLEPPEPRALHRWSETYQSYYYWYTGTLALFQTGGTRWDAWNRLLKQALLPSQETSGHRVGSWAPEGSWIGGSGGRVYATAINVLTLEIYYRYPPLFISRRN